MPSARRLSPSKSLRKLRTAFSHSHSPTRQTEQQSDPLSPLSTTSTSTSTSTTSSTTSPTTSPTLSTAQPFPGFAGFTFGGGCVSPVLSAEQQCQQGESAYSSRVIRRKKSCVEIEQEQERYQFDGALVGVVEPRPRLGVALGGIEEVLCGEV